MMPADDFMKYNRGALKTMIRKFKRALITGATGSGGSYLAEHIAEHHPKVAIHGTSRWHSAGSSARANLAGVAKRITVHECDLNDHSSVCRTLEVAKPDAIFHLAAHANVRASFATPLSVMENNVRGTHNLLEGVRTVGLEPWIQICSTSEVYGLIEPDEVPIRETTPFRPASPYAVSKIAQDMLGFAYFSSYGMKIVRTRMFAYLNPRRADLFATSFALQVARIELGLEDQLRHGNLDSVRTIIDVRDAMEAYWVALEKCRAGQAYNIGGERTISVGDFLELLRKKSTATIRTRQDPELMRPADVTLQIPDCTLFRKETGWSPRYSFEESVEFLLAECRARVRREAMR